jgi:hypothetical protein
LPRGFRPKIKKSYLQTHPAAESILLSPMTTIARCATGTFSLKAATPADAFKT